MFELSGTDRPSRRECVSEQAISRVGHSRRALCWLYAVTADANSRMLSAVRS
jgi:hypothetical protein